MCRTTQTSLELNDMDVIIACQNFNLIPYILGLQVEK